MQAIVTALDSRSNVARYPHIQVRASLARAEDTHVR
jgi:hypothetical protein